MKKVLRSFLAGAAFALGVLLIGLAVPYGYAAVVSILTQPGAGNPLGGLGNGNPANQPQNLADYNYILNAMNLNASWSGTAAPSSVIAATNTSTSKTGGSANLVQLLAFLTTTTGATTCNFTNAAVCIGFLDQNGALRWFPAD
jgi:hypothetical protein